MSRLYRLTAVSLYRLAALLLLTGISRVSAQDTAAGAVAFTGEKTAWYEGFDRYDFLMDEQTFALTPIVAKAAETFGADHAREREYPLHRYRTEKGGARESLVLAGLLLEL
jgi:hypothetical protein